MKLCLHSMPGKVLTFQHWKHYMYDYTIRAYLELAGTRDVRHDFSIHITWHTAAFTARVWNSWGYPALQFYKLTRFVPNYRIPHLTWIGAVEEEFPILYTTSPFPSKGGLRLESYLIV